MTDLALKRINIGAYSSQILPMNLATLTSISQIVQQSPVQYIYTIAKFWQHDNWSQCYTTCLLPPTCGWQFVASGGFSLKNWTAEKEMIQINIISHATCLFTWHILFGNWVRANAQGGSYSEALAYGFISAIWSPCSKPSWSTLNLVQCYKEIYSHIEICELSKL